MRDIDFVGPNVIKFMIFHHGDSTICVYSTTGQNNAVTRVTCWTLQYVLLIKRWARVY